MDEITNVPVEAPVETAPAEATTEEVSETGAQPVEEVSETNPA